MSKNNPYLFLENLIGSGNQMINLAGENIESVTNLLIRLEAVIDIARTTVPPGSGFDFPNEKRQMENHLNELRNNIAVLIEKGDKAVIRGKLQEAHRMIEVSWGL